MPLFETAKYSVIDKISRKIELREYPTFYLANTITTVDDRMSNGFNAVFDYISGQNDTKTKISMTTPVVTTVNDGKLTTGFVIPSKFSNKAPNPTNSNVRINEITNGKFIVIKFSGSWTESNFDKFDSILAEHIKNSNFKIVSERYILRYQPPFVPSVFRRNEIMYRVEGV